MYKNIYLKTIKQNTEKINEVLETNDEENILSVIQDGNQFAITDTNGDWSGSCECIYSKNNVSKGKF